MEPQSRHWQPERPPNERVVECKACANVCAVLASHEEDESVKKILNLAEKLILSRHNIVLE